MTRTARGRDGHGLAGRALLISAGAIAFAASLLLTASPANADNAHWSWTGFPQLSQGSSGGAVVGLQEALYAHAYGDAPSDNIDGNFGSSTRSQVVTFQQQHGLSADGIVGSQTWSALQGGIYREASWPTHPQLAIATTDTVLGGVDFAEFDFSHYPGGACTWLTDTQPTHPHQNVYVSAQWYRYLTSFTAGTPSSSDFGCTTAS
jgi:hypothetical protein